MANQPGRGTVPPWLYKLFTGHQYPYVRRLAKFSQAVKPGEDRPEPTKEMIEAKVRQDMEKGKTGIVVDQKV